MSDLGSRRPQDDAFPWAPALLASPLFEGMDEEMRTAFVDELEWFTLPGGATLYEENESSDAFYIVVAGCLGVFSRTSAGNDEMVARVPTGETVGELDLLGGRPRAMTVVALRDTSLLRMTKAAFAKLSQRNPGAMLHLLTQFFAWLQWPRRPGTDLPIPRTVALVPLGPTVDGASLARSLAHQVTTQRISVAVLAASRVETEAFYASEEAAHALVIYLADGSDTNWTRLCLRRADRILLAVDASQEPPKDPLPFLANSRRLHWKALDMVLLQPGAGKKPLPAAAWLDRCPVGFHSHIRSGDDSDLARLARYLTGRAIGVVLSGGGARAYGHIGVLRALCQARIPIDLVGGTSMGAIIAAGVAAGWDDADMSSRIRNAFVSSNPLDDYAFPLVALTRGRKVTRLLRENFGEVQIEDLWLPFFSVSSNLTTGSLEIQLRGSLWQALRASVAIPGLLPPFVRHGEVLVDGAVMNNLPADVMCAMGRGPLIGVDVSRYQSLRGGGDESAGRRWRRFLFGVERRTPGIASILLRSATVGSDLETRLSHTHIDLLFEPPLPNVAIRDWKSFDRAVEAGYRYAASQLEKMDLSRYAVL